MFSVHKQRSQFVKLGLWVLLATAVRCSAASHRHLLELQNESGGGALLHPDAEKSTALTETGAGESEQEELSLGRSHGAMDEPLLSIPQIMDHMLSSAFSSMDRASSGLLSNLAGPNVDFGRSKDGKRLIARLHMPPSEGTGEQRTVPSKLGVTVLGRSHMRIRLEMQGNGYAASSEHTIGLPVHVSNEGVTVNSQEDGTVHVSLPIVEEVDSGTVSSETGDGAGHQTLGSFFERRLRRPLVPTLVLRESMKRAESQDELVEELPKPEDIEGCRQRYRNDKLQRRKCMCDVTPLQSGKAVCYGALISKAVSVVRRLGMSDFATSAKHHAIECADGHTDAVRCLEKVAQELLHSLYKGNGTDMNKGKVEDRVRAAIESEDDGPSDFQPSFGILSSMLCIILLIGLFAFGAMLYAAKRIAGTPQSNRIISELSSVLTQTSKTGDKSGASLGRAGSRLGPFQAASPPQNRQMRKTSSKPGDGETKMA